MQPDATTLDTRAVDIDADAPEGDARGDAHRYSAHGAVFIDPAAEHHAAGVDAHAHGEAVVAVG